MEPPLITYLNEWAENLNDVARDTPNGVERSDHECPALRATATKGYINFCTESFLSSARPSPRVRSPTGNIGERFMVKEDSAASVGTGPWTPEGRSLTLSIAFML
ncbi:hypothetical protein AVEN_242246-1 [Araneus ventricosus]|uniref:Uncharacterized protein n=1 Tax=Araneus ventricosus TaxID=182803 RepID=A0A4Y2LC40_ARAVE|nr:hypothetical protein AVEN_242246-1 [Araneus ventricosus]